MQSVRRLACVHTPWSDKTVKSSDISIKKGRTCPRITSSSLRAVPWGVCWEGGRMSVPTALSVDELLTVLRSEILFLALLRGTTFISKQMRLEEVERKITSVKDKFLMLSIVCYFDNSMVGKAWYSSKVVSVPFVSLSWVFSRVLLHKTIIPLPEMHSSTASVTYGAWDKIPCAQASVCSVTLLNFNNLVDFTVELTSFVHSEVSSSWLVCWSAALSAQPWQYRRLNQATDYQGMDKQCKFDCLAAICEDTFQHKVQV